MTAACILHNICEIHGETFNESWLQQVDVSGTIPQLESSATRDGRGERPKVVL